MSSGKVIGAVEIGTSKVTVVVGELDGERGLNIIGKGQCTNQGMRKGEISDLKAVSGCAHAALHAAEKKAGATIDGVYLAVSGAHLSGFANCGVTNIASSDGVVSQQDVNRAAEDAKNKALGPGRVYLHHARTGMILDGRRVDNPISMVGERLELHYWHIHADEWKIQHMIRVINGYGLDVDDVIVSSIASGSILATPEEKESGVLVVDIGSGATDFALYKHGAIIRTGVIAVGGDHCTNDLSVGLRVNTTHAENIKHRYGKAIIDKDDKNEQVLMIGDLSIGDRPIPRLAIYKILQARIEETFMILKNKLGSAISPQSIPGGVILTGGASRLPHITEAARQVLGAEVRIGEPPTWVRDPELRKPEYSTVFGLLYYALCAQASSSTGDGRASTGLLRKFARILKI